MTLEEAYKTLNVDFGASKDEIKKAFKQLSIKYHPDVNKEPDATENFKKITQAYHIIEDPSKADRVYTNNKSHHHKNCYKDSGFYDELYANFYETLNNFYRVYNVKNNSSAKTNYRSAHFNESADIKILKPISITFEESVLGCKKTIKYNNVEYVVHVPAGINHGMHIEFFDNTSSKIRVPVNVIPDTELTKSGDNVYSTIEISLLDALKGCNKKVKTILGEMTLKIPAKIKHDTKIKVNGYGVDRRGAHIFTVNVLYPDDCDGLINYLESKQITETNDIISNLNKKL